MRSLFKRLNVRGIEVDISTFSKASKVRNPMVFYNLFVHLRKNLHKNQKIGNNKLALFPIDSTIVTLTSKLLWSQGFNQVKSFSGLNLLTAEPGGIMIHFGQGHDSKYGDNTRESTPENGVGVMDRGLASLERIKNIKIKDNRYFVLRINNNFQHEKLEDGQYIIGTGKDQVKVRYVNFCDLETKTEFRLVTNLPETGEAGRSNEDIAEFYRLRWQIELFWKFLKAMQRGLGGSPHERLHQDNAS